MTNIAVAIIVSDTKRADVIEAVSHLTPSYAMGFIRKCCAIDPGATWQTPPTHWYSNDAGMDSALSSVWQDAADGTLPYGYALPNGATMTEQEILDAMAGLILFTAINSNDAIAWAMTNLTSEGLQFVPDPPL